LNGRVPCGRSGGRKGSYNRGKGTRPCICAGLPAFDTSARPPNTTWPRHPQPQCREYSERWKKGMSRCRRVLHDVPPLQFVSSVRDPFTAAMVERTCLFKIAARQALRRPEIFNVNISTPRGSLPQKGETRQNSHSGNFRRPIAKRSLASLRQLGGKRPHGIRIEPGGSKRAAIE
jgi:hypothetical protein